MLGIISLWKNINKILSKMFQIVALFFKLQRPISLPSDNRGIIAAIHSVDTQWHLLKRHEKGWKGRMFRVTTGREDFIHLHAPYTLLLPSI